MTYKTLQELGTIKLTKKTGMITCYHIVGMASSLNDQDKFDKWIGALPDVEGVPFKYFIANDRIGHGADIYMIDPSVKLAANWWKSPSPSFHGRKLVVGAMRLTKTGAASQVDHSIVADKYQGQQVMMKLYQTLVTKENMMLMSDSSQSEGGLKLWRALSKQPGVLVYGWDEGNKVAFHVFDRDDDMGFDGSKSVTHHSAAESKHMERELDRLKKRLEKMYARSNKIAPENEAARQEAKNRQAELEKEIDELESQWENDLRARFNYLLIATKITNTRRFK